MKYNRLGYKTEKCASIMAATPPQQKRDAINRGSRERVGWGKKKEERRRSEQLKRQPLRRQAEKPNTKQTTLDSTLTMGNGIEKWQLSLSNPLELSHPPTHTHTNKHTHTHTLLLH